MWRSRIFWRLFAVNGVLLVATVALLGWLLIDRIERHTLAEIQRSMEVKTALLRDLANRIPAAELDAEAQRVAAETAARVTFIDRAGKVLADSGELSERMENHLDREEVRQAASDPSGLGSATRYSGTVHQPMMYVARRNDSDAAPVRFLRIAVPLDAVAAEIRWLRRVVLTATAATLGVALVCCLLIARRLTKPLVTLARAADSIARGDYGRKVFLPSTDELGSLATSFNSMSEACATQIAKIEQDRAQLQAIFRSMVEGVLVIDAEQTIVFGNDAVEPLLGIPIAASTGKKIWNVLRHRQLNDGIDRILASDEHHVCQLEWPGAEPRHLVLQGARLPGDPHRGAVLVFHDVTHLRRLETMRQDFVANVSHELKTPLAAIQATVETLLDGAIHDPEHNTRFLERIRENAERLYRLVQDVLSLGRIESSQAVLDVEPLSLVAAASACVERHADLANARGVSLTFDRPADDVVALADDDSLAEILDNLVDNAIKYTPKGGRILLSCPADASDAQLQVSDTGVGIPEQDLGRIFERFYRVDRARSRELGGTGLGLSIVKHLAQKLGGRIAAVSSLGRGSTFTLHLPRAKRA